MSIVSERSQRSEYQELRLKRCETQYKTLSRGCKGFFPVPVTGEDAAWRPRGGEIPPARRSPDLRRLVR
jgi:hypothetical protein